MWEIIAVVPIKRNKPFTRRAFTAPSPPPQTTKRKPSQRRQNQHFSPENQISPQKSITSPSTSPDCPQSYQLYNGFDKFNNITTECSSEKTEKKEDNEESQPPPPIISKLIIGH